MAIERVLINVLMMSGGGRYWGRGTLDTDENDQLKCQKCPRKDERGRRDRAARRESRSPPFVNPPVMRKDPQVDLNQRIYFSAQ